MGIVCEVCGDIGFEYLLVRCRGCNGSATHRYCLDKVVFNTSLADCWLCHECQQRHGEDTCNGSIDKVPSERQPGYAHFGCTAHQPIAKRLGSARDEAAWTNGKRISYKTKFKSLKNIYSSEKNSPQKKSAKKSSTMRPMENCTNRKEQTANATSIARTSAKTLGSCEIIGRETAKRNSGENWQVNDKNSVRTCNNVKQPCPVIVNCLGYKLGDIDLLKMRRGRKSKKISQSVTAPLKGLAVMEKDAILGSNNLEPSSPLSGCSRKKSPIPGHGNSGDERSGDKSNCMDRGADSSFIRRDHDVLTNLPTPVGCKNTEVNSIEDNRTSVSAYQNKYQAAALLTNNKCQVHGGNSNVIDDLALEREDEEGRFQQDCRASTEPQQRIIPANVTQPSTLQNGIVDKVMPYSSKVGILPKENNCLPSELIEIENQIEYQSEPSKLVDSAKFILTDSATEEESSDAIQNFGKNNPRKRRKLILLYDDDDEEEKAMDVQPENVSPRPLRYDGPMTKHRVDTESYAEEALLSVDFSNQSPNNCRPVQKQRNYMDVNKNEDEEAAVGAANSDFALNDVTNCALNDGTNLVSETVMANDQHLQSRTLSNLESADLYIYSQPVHEPVWSGFFKLNSKVPVKVEAHLSNKACQEVREVSESLELELEVEKLPRSKVQPKRWKASGPTDDCIGLFFFPHGLRPNEVSNELVSEIIDSDSALKVTVGIADLLIFPSTLLPEQNHLYQGKHYLWGVFKYRKDLRDKGVVAIEQVGPACAKEVWKQQKQNLLDQQDGSACASDSEEGQLQDRDFLNQQDLEQQEPSDKETNVMNHFEIQKPLLERNSEAQKEAPKISMTECFTLPGCSLSRAKPNSPIVGSKCSMHPEQTNQQDGITSSPEFNAPSAAELSAEGDHGQSHSGSEPPTTKLFGILVAQTPRAWQLFQEMAGEGALVFPVQDEAVTDYTSTCNSAGVGSGMNPDYQHLLEHCQPLNFISTGNEPPQPDAVASDACLELFPVSQEQIGRVPGAEVSSTEEDLELSLAPPSWRTPVFHL